MIDSLINKSILQVVGTTNKNMFGDYKNEVLEFNPHVMAYEKSDIKKLERYR